MDRSISNHLKSQRGFTLLELTATISILGILSTSALSKYSALGSETRIAVLNGVKAALSTATTLTHLQASLQHKLSKNPQTIHYSGETVQVKNGFPVASWPHAIYPILDMNASAINSNINDVCTGFDFCASDDIDIHSPQFSKLNLNSGKLVVVWMQGDQLSDHCFAYFHQPNSSKMPRSAIVSEGC